MQTLYWTLNLPEFDAEEVADDSEVLDFIVVDHIVDSEASPIEDTSVDDQAVAGPSRDTPNCDGLNLNSSLRHHQNLYLRQV
jgi:hypothetical protein